MDAQSTLAERQSAPIGFAEFVALVAALMALGALGIDAMLPALPAIGTELGVGVENQRQFVISAFLLGFGLAQLVHGPLSDRFGRRAVLMPALVTYALANLVAGLSGSFAVLLAARFASGLAVAATRVVTVAMVRDCYAGRPMARVMSLAFMVFMAAPVLAPSLGEVILWFGSWRLIFVMIASAAALVAAWFAWRLPETLRPEARLPLSPARLFAGWRTTLTERASLGYTLASTMLLGALYGFINSVQQVVRALAGDDRYLVPVFIAVAGTMALANLTNSRIVLRLGTRRISHSALVALIALSFTHLAIALAGLETIWTFAVLQALTMGCFGLATANFGAMAMEKMGGIAGTASSVQGFITVTTGAVVGARIGQAFDGTTVPLYTGFAVAGVAALLVVAITERGRLFAPHAG
ncbi:MAG: multidrug effflux MFS transporter [Sphingomonas sp.]|nr:multidrug effflux MFS transporter [Sphingomonas sp.]MBX9797053.1 multidrug effflux MFS transporter [Sphingomonas sp.]